MGLRTKIYMDNTHGGDIYRNKTEYDFSVNLNPLGCPCEILEGLKRAIETIGNYPDPSQESAVNALSEYLLVAPGNIICGNGASELFAAITSMIKPRNALVTAPTFSGYEYALRMAGECSVRHHFLKEEDGYRITPRILDDITRDTDIVFLCNPNNPTGKRADDELLDKILDKCRECDVFLVVDECFIELCDGAKSMILRTGDYEKLIVVRAFTKLFAIPGVRIGYAVSSKSVTEKIKRHLPEWNLSSFANAATIEGSRVLTGNGAGPSYGVSREDFLAGAKRIIASERAYITERLRDLGFDVFPSDTCYILFKTEREIFEALIKRGILIRDCSNFMGLKKGYYRVAIKDHHSNEVLIKNLKEIMSGT